MCIILGGSDQHPTDTCIYSLPVSVQSNSKTTSISGTLMIYKNNFKANSQDIMIVVVPTDQPIGLVDTSATDLKNIVTVLKGFGKDIMKYDAPPMASKSKSKSLGMSRSLAVVHQVDNYKISTVYSTDDLESRIDWETFSKPSDFKQRVDTINNKQLFPFDNKAIIVCQAMGDIKDDGFGCVYFSEKIFYPICHEETGESTVDYDVKIHQLHSDQPTDHVPLLVQLGSRSQYRDQSGIIYFHSKGLKRFVGKLNNDDILANYLEMINDDRTLQKLTIKPFSYMSLIPLKANLTNQNLMV